MRFITFADGNLGIRGAAKRLSRQARESGWFADGTENWTLKTLQDRSPLFFRNHADFLLQNPTGLGYWLWQPAILSQAMSDAKIGDVICMLDAGCQLNVTQLSSLRFQDYEKYAKESGALFMQIRDGEFGISDLSEFAWTRKIVIDRSPETEPSLYEPQIQSGIIIISVNMETKNFIKTWLDSCVEKRYLNILPAQDNEENYPNFVAHRHTQSVLSLMVKSSQYLRLPDETYFAPDWNNGLTFPIWAMRNRSGGDAYRRRLKDLLKIGGAKIDRKALNKFHRWRMKVFLQKSCGGAKCEEGV